MTQTVSDYSSLSPDRVLDAIESRGFMSNASLLALNSYENRVFQVGLEEAHGALGKFLIAKFYRPERWSDQQILEEHGFSFELQAQEIPVIAPLKVDGESLFEFEGFRFALFPRQGGYAPEPGQLDQLERLGALLGRIHQCGAAKSFEHRDSLSIERNLLEPKRFLIDEQFIPEHLVDNYESIFSQLQEKILKQTQSFEHCRFIRCHGDWHLGNILWRDESGGHIVDLDDCINAPSMQDVWMMLSGDPQSQAIQLQAIIKGYEQFCTFERSQLKLIESLRSIRIVYYSYWLARRWQDPAFPKNFPWFNTSSYWQQHMRELQEQIPMIESNLFDLF